MVNALDFSHPYLKSIRDPRAPEILAGLEILPLTQRLATLHPMSFAFPLLKNDLGWTTKVSTVLVELKPTPREHEDVLLEAGKIGDRLKRELAPA